MASLDTRKPVVPVESAERALLDFLRLEAPGFTQGLAAAS